MLELVGLLMLNLMLSIMIDVEDSTLRVLSQNFLTLRLNDFTG